MTPVSSRIRTRVPPHNGEEMCCWAHHPLAPTPGSKRDFQFLFFFRNHGGGWPHRQRCRGVRHELSWGGNSDATPLSVGEGMCLCLIWVASGVACLPTTVGGYVVCPVISRPPRAGRESIFWFLTKCVVTVFRRRRRRGMPRARGVLKF